MQKKILVMPDGNWLSHTSRTLEIAKELRKLGHEVIYVSEGEYMKLPKKEGFKVLPIKTLDPEHVLACSRSGRANWFSYETIKEFVEEELKLFEQEKPDMVFTDFRLTMSTSCEIAKIPLAVTLNASWTDYYDIKLKAPEHLNATRIFGKQLTTALMPIVLDMIIKVDSAPFRKYRKERGLTNLPHNIWKVWEGDLNLMVDIPDYGPTKNLPNNFHYIGPIIWEPDIEAPACLDNLDPIRPVIYITMGSTGNPEFFQHAIDVFKDTDYQVIMTTAGMIKLSNIPDNFCVVDYAPGSKVMEKADLVVCQGGNGTVYQAMRQGIPILGIPTMHDQEWNLDRVEALGMGFQLSELKFKPEHLVTGVEKMLSNALYKENALKYQKILSEYDGPKKGAELIDAYLKKHNA